MRIGCPCQCQEQTRRPAKWAHALVIIPKSHWVENWTSPAFDALGERYEEIEIHRKPDPDEFEAG